MRVWLTGGSGFLGRCIALKLKDAGHQVLAPRSTEVNLLDPSEACDFIVAQQPVHAIIHSAAYYGGININQQEPATLFWRNTQMVLSIFEAAATGNVKEIVCVGSACAYPGHLTDDLREEDLLSGQCHESVEGYGFTKRVQLIAQRVYQKQFGISWVHPVLTNLYGPHDEYGGYRSHVVAALIRRFVEAVELKSSTVTVWGDGTPVREFLYVEDAADAIVKCLQQPLAGVVNIGTGIGTSIRELVELLVEITGYSGTVQWDADRPLGTDRKVLVTLKAERVLGWTAKVLLREGLERTVEWYKRCHESPS